MSGNGQVGLAAAGVVGMIVLEVFLLEVADLKTYYQVRRGLTDVILLEGINDLRSASPAATADQIIAGYQQIIDRVHAKGARIFGATITPVEGSARYTTTMEQQRQKLIEKCVKGHRVCQGTA